MESAASAKSTRSVRGPPRACAGARRSGGSTAVPTLPTTTERSEVGALGAGVARRLVWHYPLAQQGVVAASHPPCAPSLQASRPVCVRFRHASLSARRCGGSLWCLDAWFERSPLRRRAFGARFCLTAPSTVASAVVPMAPTSTRTMAYEDNGPIERPSEFSRGGRIRARTLSRARSGRGGAGIHSIARARCVSMQPTPSRSEVTPWANGIAATPFVRQARSPAERNHLNIARYERLTPCAPPPRLGRPPFAPRS